MSETLPSYPKIFNLGHRAISNLFEGRVVVQEKVDGSQFSFGMVAGQLLVRSKGAVIDPQSPPKIFRGAVASVLEVADTLPPDLIFRGEAMQQPRHNTLAYDRFPKGHVALFDAGSAGEHYYPRDQLKTWADYLGFDIVPEFYDGTIDSIEQLRGLLTQPSFLGGQIVEGIVIKNYNQFTPFNQVAMGKLVREEFKEMHSKEWRKDNPPPKDFIAELIETYRTPARWEKAAQHLREAGTLEGDVRDIGALIKEVVADVKEECADEIKDALFKYYWKKIGGGLHHGLPDWYKDKLAQTMFTVAA